jgi:hypothetical protein
MRYTHRLEHIQIPVHRVMKEFVTKRLERYGYDPSSAFRDMYEYGGLLTPDDVHKVDELQRAINVVVGQYAGIMKQAKAINMLARHYYAEKKWTMGTSLKMEIPDMTEAVTWIEMLRDIQDYILQGQRPKCIWEVFDGIPGRVSFDYFVAKYPKEALRLAETEDLETARPLIIEASLRLDEENERLSEQGEPRWRVERTAKFTVPVTARLRNKVGVGPKEGFDGLWSIPSCDVFVPPGITECVDEYSKLREEIKAMKKRRPTLEIVGETLSPSEERERFHSLLKAAKQTYLELGKRIRAFYDSNPAFSEARREEEAMGGLRMVAAGKGMTVAEAIEWAVKELKGV